MEHSFNIEIAREVGVIPAVIFRHISFWVDKNRANNINEKEGKFWTYCSTEGFQKYFDYLTPKQIRNALQKLKEHNLILVDNHNPSKYNRTNWYTVSDTASAQKGKCICPKGQMEEPERANASAEKGKSNFPKGQIKKDIEKQIRKTDKEQIETPEWLPRQLWDDFVAMRKAIKKPMTDRAEQLMIKKLENLRNIGHNIIDLLETSIRNSWQDVYPQKPERTKPNQTTSLYEQNMEAAKRAEALIFGDNHATS